MICTGDTLIYHDRAPTPNLERQDSDSETPGWELLLLQVSCILFPIPVPPGESPLRVTLLVHAKLYTQGVHFNNNTASLSLSQ